MKSIDLIKAVILIIILLFLTFLQKQKYIVEFWKKCVYNLIEKFPSALLVNIFSIKN